MFLGGRLCVSAQTFNRAVLFELLIWQESQELSPPSLRRGGAKRRGGLVRKVYNSPKCKIPLPLTRRGDWVSAVSLSTTGIGLLYNSFRIARTPR